MPEKIEISLEQRLFFTAIFLAVGGMVLGTLLVPVFDIKLAININHTFINILPDSFSPMKFMSEGSINFQRGQLIIDNLLLLSLVVCYSFSFIYAIVTYKIRTPVKTVLFILAIYCAFYLAGFYLTTIDSYFMDWGNETN